MRQTALFRRVGLVLHPVDPEAEDLIQRLKEYDDVLVSIHRPRNIKQHRLYWVLMGMIVESQENPVFQTKEAVSDAIKMAAGYVEAKPTLDGSLVWGPRSMSEGSMPAAEFEDFFSRALDIIATRIWPGMTPGAIKAELSAILGFNYHPALAHESDTQAN
ncbi:MAG: DUF1367 family protein [Alphaproteobacteria bacterium]|nr:DUF1367 family protein [Alphaproteobacteria bacterium]